MVNVLGKLQLPTPNVLKHCGTACAQHPHKQQQLVIWKGNNYQSVGDVHCPAQILVLTQGLTTCLTAASSSGQH